MKTESRRRGGRRGERGLALLQTMLVITFVMMTMLITVRQSSEALREGSAARKQTLLNGALEHGVDHAIDWLQKMDPAKLTSIDETHYDLWATAGYVEDLIDPPLTYPPSGDFQDQIVVRVGMRPGQRTQPPPGEDVAAAFGIIMDVQIQVTVPAGLFGSAPAEERVVVGVRVPHTRGGA